VRRSEVRGQKTVRHTDGG